MGIHSFPRVQETSLSVSIEPALLRLLLDGEPVATVDSRCRAHHVTRNEISTNVDSCSTLTIDSPVPRTFYHAIDNTAEKPFKSDGDIRLNCERSQARVTGECVYTTVIMC